MLWHKRMKFRVCLMFEKEGLDEYKSEFNKLKITDEDAMLAILNYLDSIAEIGYESYMKNK